MSFTKSRFSSIVRMKCPKCGKGDLFIDRNPYHFNSLAKMNKICPNCRQRFEPETGFYYGAMYLSYFIGVVCSLLIFVIFNFLFSVPALWSYIITISCLVGASPLLFRFSRALWLDIFVNSHRDV